MHRVEIGIGRARGITLLIDLKIVDVGGDAGTHSEVEIVEFGLHVGRRRGEVPGGGKLLHHVGVRTAVEVEPGQPHKEVAAHPGHERRPGLLDAVRAGNGAHVEEVRLDRLDLGLIEEQSVVLGPADLGGAVCRESQVVVGWVSQYGENL